MSYTEIYRISKTGNVRFEAEVRNGMRSALLTWNILDEKYLPPYLPNWFVPTSDRKSAPRTMDMDEMKKVWNLASDDRLTKAERIVLCTTFDGWYVKKENFILVELAFLEFQDSHHGSSVGEQADIIAKMYKNRHVWGVCWNQTSVNADWYEKPGGYNIFNNHHREHGELFEIHPELR